MAGSFETVELALPQAHRALTSIVNGDPSDYLELFAAREEISLGNPFGPFGCGREAVARNLKNASTARCWALNGSRPTAAATSPVLSRWSMSAPGWARAVSSVRVERGSRLSMSAATAAGIWSTGTPTDHHTPVRRVAADELRAGHRPPTEPFPSPAAR